MNQNISIANLLLSYTRRVFKQRECFQALYSRYRKAAYREGFCHSPLESFLEGFECGLDQGRAEFRAIFTLFFIEHPALPAKLLQRRSDLGKRERASSQGNLFSIAVVAQMEREDAPLVSAQKCGDVGPTSVRMARIQ
jgi:hypothetical protein